MASTLSSGSVGVDPMMMVRFFISPDITLLLALVLVKLRNTYKKKEMNRKKLEKPNICYIFEKLVVQG